MSQMLSGFEDKTAASTCFAVGWYFASGNVTDSVVTFIGEAHGSIVAPRGNKSGGFDPIFVPKEDEQQLAYAELQMGGSECGDVGNAIDDSFTNSYSR